MILALDFCGSAFTGIQWVLYNPGGLRVNTSLRFFFFWYSMFCFISCWFSRFGCLLHFKLLHFFFFWYSVFSLLASESLGPPTSPRLRKSKSLPCEG